MTGLREARAALDSAERVLVLTGAGMSAESGVPTFRGADGLWKGVRPEELASPEGFRADPARVWEWYRWRVDRVMDAQPHEGHAALVALEATHEVVVVTQNVDGLHQRAGSRRVVELHGTILATRCSVDSCDGGGGEFRRTGDPIPQCRCGEPLRPDVVWFGEGLPEAALTQAVIAARECDVALVVGTASVVFPAAELPLEAARHGATTIEINPDVTPLTPHVSITMRAPASQILPRLVASGGGV